MKLDKYSQKLFYASKGASYISSQLFMYSEAFSPENDKKFSFRPKSYYLRKKANNFPV